MGELIKKSAEYGLTMAIGVWGNCMGNYMYQASYAWWDYRIADKNSPGYHFKNGLLFGESTFKKVKATVTDIYKNLKHGSIE